MKHAVYNDQHKRAAKSLLYALTLGGRNDWLHFKQIIKLRLSEKERAALAFAALRSLSIEERENVARKAVDVDLIGPPLPPFSDVEQDASWWAERASIVEKETYLMTILQNLPANDKQQLEQYLAG